MSSSIELLTILRNDVLRDYAVPYLWSDDLLMTYLNEAQNVMAEDTHCLLDNSSLVAELVTSDGQAEYDLDAAVIHVYSVVHDNEYFPLRDATSNRFGAPVTTATGKPTAYVLDEALSTITLFPTPDATYTLNMRVARRPLEAMSDTVDPEIPARLHLDLIEYAAYRCLVNNDSDAQNIGKSKVFLDSWTRRVLDAKRKYYRLRHGADPTAVRNWTGKRR